MEQQFLFCTHTCFVCKPDFLGSSNCAILFSDKNSECFIKNISKLIIIRANFCNKIKDDIKCHMNSHICAINRNSCSEELTHFIFCVNLHLRVWVVMTRM